MTYVDIHAHLDFKAFDNDREQLIKQIREKNIITFSNTLNYENYLYTKNLFKNDTDIIKVIPGLYPDEAIKISETDFIFYLKEIEKNKNKILAIGEIGLDKSYCKDNKSLETQISRFKKLIELGIKINKPLIIHTRGVENKVIEIIKEYKNKHPLYNKYVLHCFTGKKKLINDIKELNIYCSIPLIVLNTQSFKLLVEHLAISQLLVETDSPFLNPKKIRNSPLNIPKIYSEIAKIKKYNEDEIVNILYKNFMKLIYL